jgi:hypothetical protein
MVCLNTRREEQAIRKRQARSCRVLSRDINPCQALLLAISDPRCGVKHLLAVFSGYRPLFHPAGRQVPGCLRVRCPGQDSQRRCRRDFCRFARMLRASQFRSRCNHRSSQLSVNARYERTPKNSLLSCCSAISVLLVTRQPDRSPLPTCRQSQPRRRRKITEIKARHHGVVWAGSGLA